MRAVERLYGDQVIVMHKFYEMPMLLACKLNLVLSVGMYRNAFMKYGCVGTYVYLFLRKCFMDVCLAVWHYTLLLCILDILLLKHVQLGAITFLGES